MLAIMLASLAMFPMSGGFEVRLTPPAFDAVQETVTVIDPIRTDFDWDEAIVSWNVDGTSRAFLKVEAQAQFDDRQTAWLTLAEWSGDLNAGPRHSDKDQKDPDAEVQTDTLHLFRRSRLLRLRITTRQIAPGDLPKLKLLMVSFGTPGFELDKDEAPLKEAWGKTLSVPQRSQMPYEKGALRYDPGRVSPTFEKWFKQTKSDQYCSPTAVSMILNYWGVNVDVPDVVAGVFDEQYPGTGNWPFNTAYIGSFDGLESYVTRMGSLAEAERSIAKKEPLICSVSYNVLQGKNKAPGDGHLVVLVGFTKEGDPIFNDPGRSEVRQVYKREDFRQAWRVSRRTVYITRPVTANHLKS